MRGGKSAHAVVVEGGASRSRSDSGFLPEWVWRGQLEVGWEFRSKTGILVRTTSGFGFALTSPERVCTTSNGPVLCRGNATAPYATTFAIGYAF